ncbi:MAG TPA: peptide chain release factor N(5)-glutamine methyltransferase [Arenimonas sp.]|uniref:peptide chain release factor N(5)-glutamine methyltransferase n=1 Tax=Arenimonas sp. TaxID=1872635 RepID=UPI002C6A5AB0|nr:peptide chain release factor N(5)-glutamine methyltransferase [Arenimonas sp.]HMB56546.1 peptide chain release factor N(5)-glutamine methyltransferase [Arenimonas sp.]
MPATIAERLRIAADSLPGDTSRADAETLLAFALSRDRAWLYAHGDDFLDEDGGRKFSTLVAARACGEPVAHLCGRRGFWSLELAVTADTLIPRPETELLVELALPYLPANAPARVLDLGTGSGAIALAIASERRAAQVTAVDASAPALAVAEKNAAALALVNLRFLRSDWYSALADERFEVIVSNPPYLAEDDPHLHLGDLRFEPRSALVAGSDGLDDIRCIVADACGHLSPGGSLLIEHGWMQGAAIRDLFTAAGFVDVETVPDLEARDRVTLGRNKLSAHCNE